MKTSCRLWSVSLAVLASIFSASSSGQTAWLCQTGIENVRVQSPRGAALYDLVYQFRDADEIVGSW
ncbi:MAG TPA: hypothetical protein PLD93_04140, partial [Synergistaceae bacterium]|nr:hypothetical protein [Synergistaceae bacterium]